MKSLSLKICFLLSSAALTCSVDDAQYEPGESSGGAPAQGGSGFGAAAGQGGESPEANGGSGGLEVGGSGGLGSPSSGGSTAPVGGEAGMPAVVPEPNGCDSLPCEDGETCSADGVDFTCTATDACTPNPCVNGECTLTIDGFSCECADGWHGTTCEEANAGDPCAPTNPCQHGGKCTSDAATFSCNCSGTGYTGVSCQTDIDECSPSNPCQNSGTCNNTAGSYTCACATRFTGATCQHQKFRGVGVLSGDVRSELTAISGDGSTVVGISRSSINSAVKMVNSGPLQYLAKPSSVVSCTPMGVSGDGALVVGSCDDGQGLSRPMQHTSGAGVVILSVTPLAAGTPVTLTGVSADGTTMIGYIADVTSSEPIEGIRRTSSGITRLGLLSVNAQTNTNGVSGDGALIVGSESGTPWTWTAAATIRALPTSVAWTGGANASAVSRNGKVIVGHAQGDDGIAHAIRWTGTSFTDDGVGVYYDTNADGSVSSGNRDGVPTIWTRGSPQTLVARLGTTSDLSGWTLRYITGLSDDGKVVCGNGTHGGVDEGFIAHLP